MYYYLLFFLEKSTGNKGTYNRQSLFMSCLLSGMDLAWGFGGNLIINNKFL